MPPKRLRQESADCESGILCRKQEAGEVEINRPCFLFTWDVVMQLLFCTKLRMQSYMVTPPSTMNSWPVI